MFEGYTLEGIIAYLSTELERFKAEASGFQQGMEQAHDEYQSMVTSRQLLQVDYDNLVGQFDKLHIENATLVKQQDRQFRHDLKIAYEFVLGEVCGEFLAKNNKIGAVKKLRELTGWGLVDSKNFIDGWVDNLLFEQSQKDRSVVLTAQVPNANGDIFPGTPCILEIVPSNPSDMGDQGPRPSHLPPPSELDMAPRPWASWRNGE